MISRVLKFDLSACIFAAALFCWFSHAKAFDIYPEYQGLSETELDRIESPREIDSEYQSNTNSYTVPFDWNLKWNQVPASVDTSVGSLTNQHFMIYNRAKLEKNLSESLRFQFTYFSQQDREINQTRHIFELSQKVFWWLRIAAYAEMMHYKRDNDLGVALVIEPNEHWTNRFYVSFFDFTRGNHNDRSDRFTGPDPLTLGATSSFVTSQLQTRIGFRFDKSVSWNVPAQGFLFGYEKRLAFADARYVLTPANKMTTRLQWDSTFKGKAPLAGSTLVSESWRADRFLLRTAYLHGADDDWLKFEYVFMYAGRHWINGDGSHLFHTNFLPSVIGRFRSGAHGDDHIQVAIEGTLFEKYGDLELSPANQKVKAQELRLQTAYEFGFKEATSLLIALNFDLDEWSGVPTFDGGNLQFRTEL